MDRLKQRICIVTGAAAGIGRGIATAFAREGADVVVADIDHMAAVSTAAQLTGRGFKATALEHDAGDEQSWQRLINKVLADRGRLDVLVNNAASGWAAGLNETSATDWDKIARVTNFGVFLGTKLAIKAIGRKGAIINIASIAAMRGSLAVGSIAYASAKAAVISVSRAAALHCARKKAQIRVNVIAPGLIETDGLKRVMLQAAAGNEAALPELRQQFAKGVPLGFLGEPSDIGEAAVYLASDEARYVTGQLIAVDGGMTAL